MSSSDTSSVHTPVDGPAPRPKSPSAEDQALESHEVIELQLFSERKAWIEEKTKFLENMPPIEVFAGINLVGKSPEVITPGLPSRAELQQWLQEHDQIEKDTEVFDTGELKKLRKFTRAATQRNLSPEDTDLIELTLTTIFELDKLLHLLRDRSENLDLLDTRLTWEEYRTASWIERRVIIQDVSAFLNSRGRWSSSVYDQPSTVDDLGRRGSIGSTNSGTSADRMASTAFSRSARFKLAENLARDAAHFTSRITALRHGKIQPAGKTLDTLIDNSRKPVPDELLDEQDRLEEQGITDMENVGKFVMNVVMQWRKADEYYVETLKDQAAVQTLAEEIEVAKTQHPSVRQSTSFVTRAEAVLKRLQLRGQPDHPAHPFPRPTHPLYPDQEESTAAILQVLSSEFAEAAQITQRVHESAKEYQQYWEAVHVVENLVQACQALNAALASVFDRLENGFPTDDGDGTPPSLESVVCLQSTAHATFLALLPSTLDELSKAHQEAEQIMRRAPVAFVGLTQLGVETSFRQSAVQEVDRLDDFVGKTCAARDRVVAQVAFIRDARRIWGAIESHAAELDALRHNLEDALEASQWHQQAGTSSSFASASPTLAASQQASITTHAALKRLEQLDRQLSNDIERPFSSLAPNLGAPLGDWLAQSMGGLKTITAKLRDMTDLLGEIQRQTTAISTIRAEFDDLELRTEAVKSSYASAIELVLNSQPSTNEKSQQLSEVSSTSNALQDDIQKFIAGLSTRVLFVARPPRIFPSAAFVKGRPAPIDTKQGVIADPLIVELPFQLQAIDDGVRADSNSYAMRLSSGLQSIREQDECLSLALRFEQVDALLASVSHEVQGALKAAQNLARQLDSLSSQSDSLAALQSFQKVVNTHLERDRPRLEGSFSPIRDLVRSMEENVRASEPTIRDAFAARALSLSDVDASYQMWLRELESVQNRVAAAVTSEIERLEQERLAEERRLALDQERIAAEEAEHARIEEARILELEQHRQEQERLEQERLRKAEEARLVAEAAERIQRQQELEEQQRQKGLKDAEQKRLQAMARIEAERAERERLEAERVAIAEKLRSAEEQLKRERAASQAAEAARLEEEKRRKQEWLAAEAEQERLRADRERVVAEKLGRERLEQERLHLEEKLRLEEAGKKRLLQGEALLLSERAERQRLEQERLAVEAKLQQAKEQLKQVAVAVNVRQSLEAEIANLIEQRRLQDEERALFEEAKKARLEEWRQVEQEKAHIAVERERLARERIELDEKLKQSEEELAAERRSLGKVRQSGSSLHTPPHANGRDLEEDVFGLRVAPSSTRAPMSSDMRIVQAQILSLRKRLRALSIDELTRPKPNTSSQLPGQNLTTRVLHSFALISRDVAELPPQVDDPSVASELRSLRFEIEKSQEMIDTISKLAALASTIHECDTALSDLLEHVDSYPALPVTTMSPKFEVMAGTPEVQLQSRMQYTAAFIDEMRFKFDAVRSDRRASFEHNRVMQTWKEMRDMANDRIKGVKSTSNSVASERSISQTSQAVKRGRFSNLSAAPPTPSKLNSLWNVAKGMTARRAVSGSSDAPSRSPGYTPKAANRSVSGSSLYGTTFASRQRTNSIIPSNQGPSSRVAPSPSHVRSQTSSQSSRRTMSPLLLDARVSSTMSSHQRSSTSTSTRTRTTSLSSWARTPQTSLSSFARSDSIPKTPGPPPRTKYVPNPKSRLDMAVGNVVNSLSVGISVEGVSETWKDQSGKYWIGNQDPKLCFCRILRSQTVMVRVGGGWSELSKFIQDHFAESFRIPPDSPSRLGSREERWISSAALLEAPGEILEGSPRTPEPGIPSFRISTPTGSPRSEKTSPSTKGSPLQPLQFLRRPDYGELGIPLLRPASPSASTSSYRSRSSTYTPSRQSLWRP
ncbi:hypothetical protein FISHEDRAFT_76077 [Fistulina hepatica ATCC 64428]|uniref:GAR domain-containing protein n=1 Tax=Fistulina hepatica ATCC 64428 TaxID=1128425 RepID=A0A0D7A4B1_9AGAR|nr:hypothetical protein FISHEDRAFT_76077 [Fistulina hepatica ATCC 64428]